MKSKEEMIEAMARAMFLNEQNTTKGWAIIGCWESCPVWFKQQLIRHVEAALKAFCGALPDITYRLGRVEKGDAIVAMDLIGIMENLNDMPCDAKELYNQLKQWGR